MKITAFFSVLLFSLNSVFASTDAGKLEKTATDFFASLDAGNYKQLRSFLAPDFKFKAPFLPAAVDVETYIGIQQGFKVAFPDVKHTVVEGIESANAFAFRGNYSGTNTGPMQGNPPTGNRVDLSFQSFMKFDANGKIQEINVQFDYAAFMQQVTGARPSQMTDLEKNKQIARDFYRIFIEKRSTELCLPLFDEKSTKVQFNGMPEMNLQGYKAIGDAYLSAVPDLKIEITDIVAEGDKVFVATRASGTQKGPLPGLPATGKPFDYRGMEVFTIKNGKIVEKQIITDDVSFLQQLGVMPKM